MSRGRLLKKTVTTKRSPSQWHGYARDLSFGAECEECECLMQEILRFPGRNMLNEDCDHVLVGGAGGVGMRGHASTDLCSEARMELLHSDAEEIGGAVQGLITSFTACGKARRSAYSRGTVSRRGKRSKMPRQHCVKTAEAGGGSTASRPRGESSRICGGVATADAPSGLEQTGDKERRGVPASAAALRSARRARVTGGGPAASP
ncbi:hypothetical protein Emag_006920 [Eimeria magna]